MSDTKFRLHPISAIINFIKGLKDLIFPFVLIFVSNGLKINLNPNNEEFWGDLVPLAIGAFLLILNLIGGIVKWRRFVYWFEEGELRVEYGLFVKKKRYIPFERIQSLNYKEGIFHRPFGLVKVSVETAGSNNGKAEAELTAITREAADTIEVEMKRAKKEKRQGKQVADQYEGNRDNVSEDVPVSNQYEQLPEEEVAHKEIVHRMSIKDLLILATTSGGVGVVFSGIAAFASQFGNIIPYDYLYDEFRAFVKIGILLVLLGIFLVLLIAWGLSLVLTLFNYYDFIVERESDKLIITRGLIEKKRITIPINRIQGIKIVENPLRQMFGYATVVVESAGGSAQDDERKIVLMPLVKKLHAMGPLQQLFPDINWQPMLKRSPKRARPYYYRIEILWSLLIVALVSYFFFPFGLLSFFIIPLAILNGVWQHKTAGYAVEGNQLTIVYRTFSKITVFMEKKRIQQMSLKQTYFRKRKDIASIGATIISGSAGFATTVAHFEKTDMDRLMEWYKPNVKSTHDEKQVNEL